MPLYSMKENDAIIARAGLLLVASIVLTLGGSLIWWVQRRKTQCRRSVMGAWWFALSSGFNGMEWLPSFI